MWCKALFIFILLYFVIICIYCEDTPNYRHNVNTKTSAKPGLSKASNRRFDADDKHIHL